MSAKAWMNGTRPRAGTVETHPVFDRETHQSLFESLRQGFICQIHVVEKSISALRGNFERIKHGCCGWLIEAGHICMPIDFAIAQDPNWNAVLPHIGHDVKFRLPSCIARFLLTYRRCFKRSEPLAEREKLRIGDLLIPKDEHEMIQPRLVNLA